MAIQFRCDHCQTLMSIATRKAGSVVRCAACDEQVLVPLESQTDAGAALPPPVPTEQRPSQSPRPRLGGEGQGEGVSAPTDAEDGQDRVALPDDLFEFEEDEPPLQTERESAAAESDAPPEITGFFDLEDEAAEPESVPEPESAQEAPPLHRSTEEVPPKFVVQLRKSSIDDEMDLTPMVDVVFQLLIFFMVTASFALHKTIQTPTPESNQKGATQSIQSLEELEGVAILVRIDGQNGITIDDDPLPDDSRVADALLDKMRKEQKSEIIITADAAAWHRTVVKVVDAANEVGMQKIRLATRSGPAE